MSETRLHTFGSRFLTTALLLWLAGAASLFAQTTAQERASQTVQRSSLTITASAAGDRVRIAAPSAVVQMRVEVYGAGSEKLFDQEIRGGNVFDWHVQDGQAQRLAAGTYICVVTAKNISGKLTQKMGTVIVEEKSVSVQPADSQQLSVQQAQTIGPVEENPSWTIPGKDEQQTTTVIAHDGTDGQLTRGRGALSFRIGDFFSGNDMEQMRLTEEGNLGIGTDSPQAKLDVAGVIRTSKGIEFANGIDGNVTKLTTTATGSLQQTLADGTVVPNATGTGTQNKLAKWTDNAGTLGDSVVTEASGNIGIGTSSPQAALHVIGNQFLKPVGATPTYEVLAGSDPSTTVMLTTDSSAFGWQIAPSNAASDTIVQVLGQNFAAVPNRGEFGIYLGADSNSAFKVIQRGGPELMRVNRAGNVGIGTTNPLTKTQIQTASTNGVQNALALNNPSDFGAGQGTAASALLFTRTRTFDVAHNTMAQIVGGNEAEASSAFGFLTFGTRDVAGTMQERMRINSTGNVGVGTASPQARLDVRGNVKLGATGQLFAPGGEENLRIIRGVIDANGNIIVGAGFTATHDDSFGHYTITFNTPFAGAPAVTATVEFGPSFQFIDTNGVTANTVKFIVGNDNSSNPSGFHFIAIGPR